MRDFTTRYSKAIAEKLLPFAIYIYAVRRMANGAYQVTYFVKGSVKGRVVKRSTFLAARHFINCPQETKEQKMALLSLELQQACRFYGCSADKLDNFLMSSFLFKGRMMLGQVGKDEVKGWWYRETYSSNLIYVASAAIAVYQLTPAPTEEEVADARACLGF